MEIELLNFIVERKYIKDEEVCNILQKIKNIIINKNSQTENNSDLYKKNYNFIILLLEHLIRESDIITFNLLNRIVGFKQFIVKFNKGDYLNIDEDDDYDFDERSDSFLNKYIYEDDEDEEEVLIQK